MEKVTNLLGEEINYTVRRSNRATIPRIDVSLNGVRVVIPEDSDKDPEDLLQEKALTVIKNLKEFDEYRDKIPHREFKQGEKFPFLGEECILTVSNDVNKAVLDLDVNSRYRNQNKDEDREEESNQIQYKNNIKNENPSIVLPLKEVEQKGIKTALENFYKEQAREIVEEILEDYSEMGFEYNQLKIKNQKTRWGSCSSKENLNINWRITMAPKEIVEYIVVHELVHLEEDNHTKKFWAKLSSLIPDYKERAEWLEENSPRLVFSEEDY